MNISDKEKLALFDAGWEYGLIGKCIVAQDGRFINVNPTWERITGYTEAELQKKTFMDITHPLDVEPDVEMAADVAAGRRRIYDMKKRYITKTEDVIWLTLRVVPIKREDGSFEYFYSQILPERQRDWEKLTEIAQPRRYAALWQRTKENWPVIAALAGGASYIAAEIIKYIKAAQ